MMKDRNLKIIGLVGLFVFLLTEFVVFWNNDFFAATLEKYHRNKEYKMMHEPLVDVSSLPQVKPSECRYRIIRHSGGGKPRTYSNSLESWEESYASGCRIMDADMAFTSDGVLVLRHEWDDNTEQTDVPMLKSKIWKDRNGSTRYNLDTKKRMSYLEFIHTLVYRQLHPMSCDDMLRYMEIHKDLYVATDMKDDVAKSYRYLVNRARKLNLTSVLDRIIISCYTYEDYDTIMSVYPFKERTIRQYINHPHNYYELAAFCVKHDIPTVNISYCYVHDEGLKVLCSKGINVYVAVVDDWDDFNVCRKQGVYGCVSNYLFENQFKMLR